MRARKTSAEGKNGLAKETFSDGKISAGGPYVNGKKTGVWKYYFRNGLLKATGK
jgi:antitoxin component YwqK of YwqJK toxin-antitoxin module